MSLSLETSRQPVRFGSWWARLRRPNEKMIVDHGESTRLFPTRSMKLWMAVLLVGFVVLPIVWERWPVLTWLDGKGVTLNSLTYAGVFAIAAIGLNLLTGYTGQVSLGHSVFLGLGAYFTAYVGTEWSWPLWLWVPGATLVGFLVGAVVGPFALRLRGNYLVVVTLGLVFVGEHVFKNWNSVTGGNAGTSAAAVEVSVGPLDFRNLEVGPWSFDEDVSLFWLVWFFVALSAFVVKNIVRSRPGRAFQAVRDRDHAAEVIGVDLFRYKTQAFAVSSALAALGGALYAPLQLFIGPDDFALLVSIQFIAMIILGGLGTVYGSIIGALMLTTMPRFIEGISGDWGLPGVANKNSDPGLITVSSLNVVIYGLLIAGALLVEPRGLAAVVGRIKTYFKSWPFKY